MNKLMMIFIATLAVIGIILELRSRHTYGLHTGTEEPVQIIHYIKETK